VPTLIAHFPLVEIQALWTAQYLHGGFEKAKLPDTAGMLAYWDRWVESRKELPATQFQAFNMYQWPFCNMLRDITGTPRLDPPCWRQSLWCKALGTLATTCNFRDADIDSLDVSGVMVSEDPSEIIH